MEIHNEASHECIICLDDAKVEWRELECHHRYHKQCIEDWISVSARCPLCMSDVNENMIEERHRNDLEMDEPVIQRFVIFICFIIAIIVIMVVCSSYNIF